MAGLVAVAVAARAARAGFAQAPGCTEALAHALREQPGERLGRRAKARHILRRDADERRAARARIDDAASQIPGGGSRHRHERGVDQAAGGRFGDRERLLAFLEQAADDAAGCVHHP